MFFILIILKRKEKIISLFPFKGHNKILENHKLYVKTFINHIHEFTNNSRRINEGISSVLFSFELFIARAVSYLIFPLFQYSLYHEIFAL